MIARNQFVPVFLLAALCAAPRCSQASERVSLSNGFTMSCDHHLQQGDQVRLYMSAGEDSFIEMPASRIEKFERIPDARKESAQPAPATRHATRLNDSELRQVLSREGRRHDLDVDLLASLVKAESDGNSAAVSRAGARGLMQLMPGTARELGVKDSFEPKDNVRGGTQYLDDLLVRYHDNLAKALAAYNAGPAAVDRYHGVPPYRETRAYVARIIREFNRRVLARERAEQKAGIATNVAP